MPKASYDPSRIEPYWQARWEADALYQAVDFEKSKPKWYALVMFPYTSGDLHVGHWFAYTGPDVHARYRRMRGYNVLFPFGFDAFGLPAENAAIKNGGHPADYTTENMERMVAQLRTMGSAFQWDRRLATSEPKYYRWTQWLFLQLYKKGLAYKAKAPVNWCPKDQTVLANEQVIDGRCERCDSLVVKKELEQWFFRITDYAEELLSYDGLDWPGAGSDDADQLDRAQRGARGRLHRDHLRRLRGEDADLHHPCRHPLWGHFHGAGAGASAGRAGDHR